jgi:hypothetical protein
MQEGINSNVSTKPRLLPLMMVNPGYLNIFLSYQSFIADSVVVITGASSGMGKEITYRYAERGCKIVIGSRNL